MVRDESVEDSRDVDVTVKVNVSRNEQIAFKGYEVKRESPPLDVAKVEQLALKLADMRGLTHRAIVSTSGFTENAKKKAASHGIDLFELVKHDGSLEAFFPSNLSAGKNPMRITGRVILLKWVGGTYQIEFPHGTDTSELSDETPVYDESGNRHKKFGTLGELEEEILLTSTGELLKSPGNEVTNFLGVAFDPITKAAHLDARRESHDLDLTHENVFLKQKGLLIQIGQVRIKGLVQWYLGDAPVTYAMRNVADGAPFAGALVSVGPREGVMNALVFAPTSGTIEHRVIQLTEKQRSLIRDMKLKL
jgi:hypothetical protein